MNWRKGPWRQTELPNNVKSSIFSSSHYYMYLKKALIEWEIAHWTDRLLICLKLGSFWDPSSLNGNEVLNPLKWIRVWSRAVSCVWLGYKAWDAACMVTLPGRWEGKGKHGSPWRDTLLLRAIQVAWQHVYCKLGQHENIVSVHFLASAKWWGQNLAFKICLK